jgi:hypothetical protein
MDEQDMPEGKPVRKRWVLRGLMEAFLPMQAWRNLRDSGRSLTRTGRMIISGKPSDEFGSRKQRESAGTELDRAEAALIREGKGIIFSLPSRERFEAMYHGMEWTEEKLEKQKTSLRRGHAIRLFFLYLAIVLLPGVIYRYGLIPMISTLSVIAFLWVMCLRSFCWYTQLQERALMDFKELKDRLGWAGLMAKATWFLD